MNVKTTTEGHYRKQTSPNNSRIAQENVTTRDYHLESRLQGSGLVLNSVTQSIMQVYNMYIQLHNQLHQPTTCTVRYTVNYISLKYVHSVTPSITPNYNLYSQLHSQLHKFSTCTCQITSFTWPYSQSTSSIQFLCITCISSYIINYTTQHLYIWIYLETEDLT